MILWVHGCKASHFNKIKKLGSAYLMTKSELFVLCIWELLWKNFKILIFSLAYIEPKPYDRWCDNLNTRSVYEMYLKYFEEKKFSQRNFNFHSFYLSLIDTSPHKNKWMCVWAILEKGRKFAESSCRKLVRFSFDHL